jgi:hypothetical protein
MEIKHVICRWILSASIGFQVPVFNIQAAETHKPDEIDKFLADNASVKLPSMHVNDAVNSRIIIIPSKLTILANASGNSADSPNSSPVFNRNSSLNRCYTFLEEARERFHRFKMQAMVHEIEIVLAPMTEQEKSEQSRFKLGKMTKFEMKHFEDQMNLRLTEATELLKIKVRLLENVGGEAQIVQVPRIITEPRNTEMPNGAILHKDNENLNYTKDRKEARKYNELMMKINESLARDIAKEQHISIQKARESDEYNQQFQRGIAVPIK